MPKLFSLPLVLLLLFYFSNCKKNTFITDQGANIELSQDSVLFDTVFTTIGSATKNIRIRNKNSQPIKISSIQLEGGKVSQFKINVDGAPGVDFTDIEIAAHDSMYVFIQVNVNPTNQNSPLIVTDKLIFKVNGNTTNLLLEAWGQDAYYYRPTTAIYFKDGTYIAYSRIAESEHATVIWNNDKPHVIYGFLVVDSTQKLIINPGTKVYMNFKSTLWVYRYGELKVRGAKGNEVIFQGARREPEYANEPGQWDRIWINEGSNNNEIDYAIIKNGFIGVQTDIFGNTIGLPGRLKLTNTKIQNMSMWGLYALAYNIYGANNVISNCKEHSLNILFGGTYTFIHCDFVNFWNHDTREKTTVNISNYNDVQVLPMDSCYFGNCIIDGKLTNEVTLDAKSSGTIIPQSIFSGTWLKTNIDVSDPSKFMGVRVGTTSLTYMNVSDYNFEPAPLENGATGFSGQRAINDALKTPMDIQYHSRVPFVLSNNITAGAYIK